MRTRVEDAVCPACGGRGLDFNAVQVELPYLGTSLETLLHCTACGYRHADFILTEMKAPTRVSYRIRTEEDMMVRVVRSSSGTIRIPEVGVLIEPGIASEAFISNIEGVIVRIERVLDLLHRDEEDDAQRQRIEALIDLFARLRRGQGDPVTLVIEDPFGNSSILAEAAVREPIPEEEANQLRVGMTLFDPEGLLEKLVKEEGKEDDAAPS